MRRGCYQMEEDQEFGNGFPSKFREDDSNSSEGDDQQEFIEVAHIKKSKRDKIPLNQKEMYSKNSNSKRKQMELEQLNDQPLTLNLLKKLLVVSFDMNKSSNKYLKYSEERLLKELKHNLVNTITLLIQIILEDTQQNQQNQENHHQGEQFQYINIKLQFNLKLKVFWKENKMNIICQKRERQQILFDIDYLLNIIDQRQQVKISAAVQLANLNRRSVNTSSLTYLQKTTIIMGIVMILCQKQNCQQVKKQCSIALSNILRAEQTNNQLILFIIAEIEQLLNSDERDRKIGGILLINALIDIRLPNDRINYIMEVFFPLLIRFGKEQFSICSGDLSKYQSEITSKRKLYPTKVPSGEERSIDRFKVSSQEVEGVLNLLSDWSDLILRLIVLFNYRILTIESSLTFLNSTLFFNLINGLIHLQVRIPEQIKNCLISFSSSYLIDSSLNSNLVKCIQIIIKSIKILLRHRNNDMSLTPQAKSSAFCQMLKDLIPESVLTLMSINAYKKENSQLINEFKVDQVKNEIMNVVKQSLMISELNDYFFSQRISFICSYISPLVIISEESIEDFKKFEQSYLQNMNEFLDLNGPEINITAANLTIKFCQNVHGALSFFVKFFIENIFSLLHYIPSSSPQFEVLSQADGSTIRTSYDSTKQIEICLSSLLALRKLIKDRADLILIVDQFFIMNVELLLKLMVQIKENAIKMKESQNINFNREQLSDEHKQATINCYIISHILLVFSELCNELLTNNEEVYEIYIRLILDCSSNWNNFIGSRMIMHQILYNMVSKQKDKIDRVQRYSNDIFQSLMEQLLKADDETYFDCLNAVIQKYKLSIFQNEFILYNTIDAFINKILYTLNNTCKQSKIYLEGIKYPFLILELIMGWTNLPIEVCISIDTNLNKLYQLLDDVEDHDLSESILKLARLQLQRMGGIKTDIAYKVLFKLRTVYEKEQNFFFEMYKLLNQVFHLHPSIIVQDTSLLYFLVKLAADGITTQSNFSTSFDKSLSCLIAHLIMHNFNQQILPQHYQLFLKSACNSIKNGQNEGYLQARLVEIILSCTEININQTFEVLEANQFSDQFMQILLKQTKIFDLVYDKKLYIIGVCKMLSNYQNFQIVRDNFVSLFSCSLDMLESILKKQDELNLQKNNQIEKAKKKIEQKIELIPTFESALNEANSSDDSDNDEKNDDSDVEADYQDLLNRENKENSRQFTENDFEDEDSIAKQFKIIYSLKEESTQNKMEEDEICIPQSKKKQLARQDINKDVAEMYEDSTEFKQVQKYALSPFTEEQAENAGANHLKELEENSENSFKDFKKIKRAQKSIKILHTPLKKLDEFSLFRTTFERLRQSLSEIEYHNLINKLEGYQINNLNDLMKTERVVESLENVDQETQIRRIVKLRRRDNRQQEEENIEIQLHQ